MRFSYHIAIATLIFCGCSSDEPSLPDGPATEDNVYLEMNKWIYGQMNRQYLWREDLPDSMRCDYNLAPREFFNSLLSAKDRFSYFTTNDSYDPGKNQYTNLGFAYQEMQDKTGNKALEILYITSPEIREYGIKRGDFVRVANNNGNLFSLEKISFENGCFSSTNKRVSLSVKNPFQSSTVLLDSIYNEGNISVGYLCYLQYGDKEDLEQPLKNFANNKISELILDLRYNPGGYVSTCRFLSNCIVPSVGYNKVFQQCSYNTILSHDYLQSTGDSRTYSYFEVPGETLGEQLGVILTPLNLKRLYVITSSHTASASEATIICLRSYMDVTVIGETTVGKGVGSWTISDSRFRYAIQPITMRYYNADGYSTPDTGIEPDIYAADGYLTGKLEIGDKNERLLKIALAHIKGEALQSNIAARSLNIEIDNYLTPIGEPSYITEFNNKHYNESN